MQNVTKSRAGHPALSETAASHLVMKVPRASAGERVEKVLAGLIGSDLDLADTVFVVDEREHLAGAVTLPALLRANPDTTLGELMRPVRRVTPDTNQEAAALAALEAGQDAMPVVDLEGRLVGAIPAHALLAVLHEEHELDLRRLAGIRRRTRGAASALDASAAHRIHDRLPWLLVGVAGSAVSAIIMARYEALLGTKLAVAFFVPAIVYLADAIGTQSEAVVVRGLSVSRRPLWGLLGSEIAAGAGLGLLTALLVFPVIAWLGQDVRIALAVAVTLVLAGGTAAATGTLLPWSLSRLGRDPAYGSGPLATIIQDVASLMIYFLVVSRFLS